MSDPAHALREFHIFFRQEPGTLVRFKPTMPTGAELELRKTLIREEFEELMEALDGDDVEHAYKELADLVYVCYGLDQHMGSKLSEVFDEVHRSNMSKVWPDGTVQRRDDGKISKPDSYVKPDLSHILREEPQHAQHS